MPKKNVQPDDGLTNEQRANRETDPFCIAMAKGYPVVQGIFGLLVQVATQLWANRVEGDDFQAVMHAENIITRCAQRHGDLAGEIQKAVNAQSEALIAQVGIVNNPQQAGLDAATMEVLTQGMAPQ